MNYDQWSNEVRLELVKALFTLLTGGLLLLFGTSLLSRAVERYKASQSLRVALSTKRAEKIAEVVAALFELETFTIHASHDFAYWAMANPDVPFVKWGAKFHNTLTAILKKQDEVELLIKHSYFFLGSGLQKRLLVYLESINQVGNLIGDEKFDEAEKLIAELEVSKPTVIEFIQNPDA